MSVNKNALVRYKVLDKCFRNFGRRYFIEDLIEECNWALVEINPQSSGISRRQIFDDISFMESNAGWEVELLKLREGKRVYYRYADPNFSINNMPLNEIEINHLKAAIDILTQFKGMPQFEWINELLPKIYQDINDRNYPESIIEFDTNKYLKGIEFIGSLYNSIHYKKAVSILYQPFGEELPSHLIIHPYHLKQYNNRWFLFGYNPEKEKFDWNMALDRIQSVEEIQVKFKINNQIDWSEYFEDIVGVTKPTDAKLEKIELHFYERTGKYIESKPIHGSQKSKWLDENTLEVKLDLILNYEFEQFLMSYADSIKVIKPISLKLKIQERIEKAYKNSRDLI